jgi:2-aminoadipate transaminase
MISASAVDWSRRFARRAQEMKPSRLRELLKVTARPGMISFAGGLPAAELFPIDRVQAAVQAVLRRVGGRALQYGETEGVAELRDWIARHYSNDSLQLTRDNVLVTTGAQQALDLIGRVLLDEGDRVIVENPTYMAALMAWRPLGTVFLPAAADEYGVIPEQAAPLFAEDPKIAYLIPNFQNPTGACLTTERRKLVVGLAQERDVPLIEDDPYGELRYEGDPAPSLLELDNPPDDGGRVLRTGTFSKTLMPGLRVGWIIGPRAALERMGRAKQSMDLHTSTFNQHLALELINGGYLEEMIPKLRSAYRERRDAMLDSLAEHFPEGSHWARPQGGMFVFVAFPPEVSAGELLTRAIEQNVAFVPGEEFHLNGAGKNTMRLNFTKSNPSEIREGIRRLADLLKSPV